MPSKTTQTAVSSIFLVLSFYLVCLANSTSDDWNPNSGLPVKQREILPDIPMRFVQRLLSLRNRDDTTTLLAPEVPDLFVALSLLLWLVHLVGRHRNILAALDIARRSFYVTGTWGGHRPSSAFMRSCVPL